MSEQYQRVEPTPFDAPNRTAESATTSASSPGGLPKFAVPALALLVVAALFVVFLLPSLVENNDEPAAPLAGSRPVEADASGPAAAVPAQDDEQTQSAGASPFADAVEARARAEAQELLAELIDVRENLTTRGAEQWATEEMESIANLALAGDETYRERRFEEAIEQYSQALTAALALEQSLPERFSAQLALVDEAIEDLDAAAAADTFELAALLEPGDPALREREQRIAALPDVQTAVSEAQAAETAGDLAGAVASYEAALESDTRHIYVRSERDRVAEALRLERFNAAMSEGYDALDQSDFDRAQSRFEAAAKLEPGSTEAAAALAELSVARTTATLNRLQRDGEQHINDEDWATAISVFEEALAIDGSLRFAREGLALARPRAALDKEMMAILDKPERLVDNAILAEAEATLRRAREATPAGETLNQQIQDVAQVLEVARTPLAVQLRSDGLTEVTVYKVARLGLFDSEELSLRPGEYTAVGSRRGFRDVRVVFTVAPGNREPVFIACTEAI